MAHRLIGWSVFVGACSLFPDVGPLATHVDASGDASTPFESSTDAPIVDSEASTPFCAGSTHAFCADFDEGALTDGWTTTHLDAPGTIALSTAESVSPTRSFLSTMPRRASSAPGQYATLQREFVGYTHMIVDFDFYVVTPDWTSGDVNSGMLIIAYRTSGNSTIDDVTLSLGETYTTLGYFGGSTNSGTVLYDQWLHAHLDIDALGGTMSAKFGPTSNFAETFTPPTPGTNETITLELGVAGFNAPAPRYLVYFDNVVVDTL